MPAVRVRGARLHHEDRGPHGGPVVLLLHGALRDASVWARHADALASSGWRVLSLDDRGHGQSEPFGPQNAWSGLGVPTLAEDAGAFLDAVAPGARVVVVGHSRGGTVGAWLAVERPDLVAGLVAVCTPAMASEAFRARWRATMASEPTRGSGDEALRARTLDYLARIPDDHFPAESMTRFRGRALVVEAGQDPLYSPVSTMFWRAWLRQAEVERFEGGHDFLFDGGAGEAWFGDRIARFLAGAP